MGIGAPSNRFSAGRARWGRGCEGERGDFRGYAKIGLIPLAFVGAPGSPCAAKRHPIDPGAPSLLGIIITWAIAVRLGFGLSLELVRFMLSSACRTKYKHNSEDRPKSERCAIGRGSVEGVGL